MEAVTANEDQIITKAIKGDAKALSVLIDNYKDIAYNLALSLVKNKDDAKDIVQDSFIKVLENIGKFRNQSKFSTWLYRIVYHQSLAFLKKSKKTASLTINVPEDDEYSTEPKFEEQTFKELHRAIENL